MLSLFRVLRARHRELLLLLALGLPCPVAAPGQTNSQTLTRQTVLEAEKLSDLNFSDTKLDMMLPDLREQLA